MTDDIQNNQPLNKKNLRGQTETGAPNPVDIYIGSRIRLRRGILGLSQKTLADALGLSFQQIQKYEKGLNRIGGSRLVDMAMALATTVDFFLHDIPKDILLQSPMLRQMTPEQQDKALNDYNELQQNDPMQRTETLRLVRAYYRIRKRKLAEQTLVVLETMASTYPVDDDE